MSQKNDDKRLETDWSDEFMWYVYIVECRDGSLYTGITTDIIRRVKEHNESTKGAKYTRARRPVRLVYQESKCSKSDAAKREYEIKKFSKNRKMSLIVTQD